MDFFSILIIVIIAAHIILIGLIFKSLSGAAKAEPENTSDGRKVMRPSKVLLWMAIMLAIWTILGLYMGGEALTRERGMASGLLMAMILTLTTGLSGAWLLARYLNYRIIWDDKILEVSNWRGENLQFNWTDLEQLAQRSGQDAAYMPLDMTANTLITIRDLELRFNNQGVVRAAPNLIGYYGFVEDVKKHWQDQKQAK